MRVCIARFMVSLFERERQADAIIFDFKVVNLGGVNVKKDMLSKKFTGRTA
jgi:hypothetical protein